MRQPHPLLARIERRRRVPGQTIIALAGSFSWIRTLGECDAPLCSGEQFVEGNELGPVQVLPVDLERSVPLGMHATRAGQLVEVSHNQVRPGLHQVGDLAGLGAIGIPDVQTLLDGVEGPLAVCWT